MPEPPDPEVPPASSSRTAVTTRLGSLPGSGERERAPKTCITCGRTFAEGLTCPHCVASHPADGPPVDSGTAVDSKVRFGHAIAVDAGVTVDGRYRVDSELGRGGMGVVYLAKDTWLDRPVALKVIAPNWAGDTEIAGRFQREAKALASIRNQYVVQVYAFGIHDGSYFFAMEFVRGRTLRQIMTEHQDHGDTIPVHRTLTILSRIAQGIDAVHAAGIIHRDVKPSNIVIEQDTGRPVLVDFGLAVPGDDPEAALTIGTPHYMAPEQGGVGAPGAVVGPRIDVYALGITAFEMLTGELPFEGTDRAQLMRKHARKQPPALSSKKPELAPFDKSIWRALAKDPTDRFPSCTAFAEVLVALSDRYVSAATPSIPPPPPSTVRDGPPVVTTEPPASPAKNASEISVSEISVSEISVSELSAAELGAPEASTPGLSTPPLPLTPSASTSGPPSGPPASVEGTRIFHVLVVDDSPVFRKFTVQATQIALFRTRKSRAIAVQGAGSGEEAITMATAQAPDLVLLDFDMPGLDGVGTLSKLRALPGGHSARVVVLSGRVRAIDRWRFAVLGVSDFVHKPIDFRQLVNRIEAISRRHEEGRTRSDPIQRPPER